MRRIALILLFVFLSLEGFSQLYKDDKTYKLGVQFGVSFSRFTGGKIPNAAFRRGFNSDVNFYKQLGKSNVHLYSGAIFSVRGSKFKNDQDELERIVNMYIDVPLGLMFDITGGEQKTFLRLGGYGSYLLQSEAYTRQGLRPFETNVKIKPYDIAPFIGIEHRFYYFALQMDIKYGVVNLDNGLEFVDQTLVTKRPVGPPLKNGQVHNLAIDINLLF